MLSILNILSFPIFKNFTVISGHKSLNKAITRTAIFEWESLEDAARTFEKGDFVLTTLVTAKDDPEYAETCLRTLINLQIGCIAIKDIYIKEIPAAVQVLSNFQNVPIIIFSETYYDDIIFSIKQELFADNLASANTNKIEKLLEPQNDPADTAVLIKELNPFFYDDVVCCFSLFDTAAGRHDLDHYYQQYLTALNDLHVDSKEYVLSIVRYKDGIFIILSYDNAFIHIEEVALHFLNALTCFSNDSKNGISTTGRTRHLNDLIKESIYAAISCAMDKESYKFFSAIGIDQILIPSGKHPETKKFYDHYFNLLNEHDEAGRSNFLETLLTYIQSDGDVALTAEILYQHKNTIRYRINKIKTILGLEESTDSKIQLHIFARLYLIHQFDTLLPDPDESPGK